ncbi:MAG TPA: hypothetical protein VHD36_21605 [Pirellulales bacterium]|nr:hypothetical protein [Pirellulales bacterium]
MDEWRDVRTQADANVLLEVFGRFHDSCIREAHLTAGHWVSSDLCMSCPPSLDNKIQFLVQRQFKNPSAIELQFDEVTRFNFVPTPEGSDSIILEATLLVQDANIFWSVQGDWNPDRANRDEGTWVSAKKLRWRAVDWLGEELRYGPKPYE